ncbi:unnamed protein product [Peronospora farinosa]|uniref:VHS domain-containing protein n=1 Tax=Peronospora farinosa TaxID=134698 RepID=A0AAV0T307_9STRA|nr:unnamed protein product [Peronospora farinosa]CAI5713676.1 unnamed protein product [Peronospora farinosa]
MDVTIQSLRKKIPSKRQVTLTINQLVQQKTVAVSYTPMEIERITQLTTMITQATNEFETDEDWDRILRVVDALSNVVNRAVLKESVRYLRLRLGDPSSRVVVLALTLTESIVKNCGDLVHQEIASESFMNEMEALYRIHANKRGRTSMEIASRVLDMIQAWGEAFLPFRHEFPLFVDTYHNMRRKGIKFPDQYDESKVPVLTPPVDVTSGGRRGATSGRFVRSYGSNSINTSSYSNTSSGLGGLSTLELYGVATNVSEMFEDMLYEAQKDTCAISNHGVMEELAVQVREIVHRMEGAIPIAVGEEDKNLAKYLSINDDLHAALKKYDELLAKKQNAVEETAGKSKKESVQHIDLVDPFGLKEDVLPQRNEKNQNLIDDDPFADFVRACTVSKIETVDQNKSEESLKSEVETKAAPKASQEEDDPFASFVQERATKILSSSNRDVESKTQSAEALEPAASTKDLIDLWDDVHTAAPTLSQPATTPDLWLGGDPLSHSMVLNTASTKTPAHDSRSGNIANTYCGLTTSVARQPSFSSTTSSTIDTKVSDPFEMLDFSTKASSILTPNPPNNLLQPTSLSTQTKPMATSKSFNPFDF